MIWHSAKKDPNRRRFFLAYTLTSIIKPMFLPDFSIFWNLIKSQSSIRLDNVLMSLVAVHPWTGFLNQTKIRMQSEKDANADNLKFKTY
jgi:hypothetical protein